MDSVCVPLGWLGVVSSITYLGVLGYYDLKSRTVPDLLVYAYLATGLVLYSLNTLYLSSYLSVAILLAYTGFSAILITLVFYLLYRCGYIGDGDVYVSFATGLLLAYPSSYCGLFQRFGILPPGLVVVLYSSMVVVARMSYDALVNIVRYKEHVRKLSGVYRFIVPLLARPVRVVDLRSGSCRFTCLAESFSEENGVLKRSFKLFSKVSGEEDLSGVLRLLETHGVDYVWVSHLHPFVFYMFLGAILFVIFGDEPLIVLFKSINLQ